MATRDIAELGGNEVELSRPELTGIPAELRQDILKILLKSYGLVKVVVNDAGYLEQVLPKNGQRPSLNPSILLACKLLFSEATPILYSENDFVVPWNAVSTFKPRRGNPASSLLYKIKIDCEIEGPAFGFVSYIKILISKFPNLEKVELSFNQSSNLLAGVYELTTAVSPCAYSLQCPKLQVLVAPPQLEEQHSHERPYTPIQEIQDHFSGIFEKKLSDISTVAGAFGHQSLSKPSAQNLKMIEISGVLARRFLRLLGRHKCTTGRCHLKILSKYSSSNAEDHLTRITSDSRRILYSWEEIQELEAPIECDMRQFLPALPARYKNLLGDNKSSSAVPAEKTLSATMGGSVAQGARQNRTINSAGNAVPSADLTASIAQFLALVDNVYPNDGSGNNTNQNTIGGIVTDTTQNTAEDTVGAVLEDTADTTIQSEAEDIEEDTVLIINGTSHPHSKDAKNAHEKSMGPEDPVVEHNSAKSTVESMNSNGNTANDVVAQGMPSDDISAWITTQMQMSHL